MIGCPGLGTGVGKLIPKDAVDQMEMALQQFNQVMQTPSYSSLIIAQDQQNLVLARNPCPQPDTYANTELQ